MKLHLHKTQTREQQRRLVNFVALKLSESIFRLVEWTFVLATLRFLYLKTGDWSFNALFTLCATSMYVVLMTNLSENLDLQIWARPLKNWQIASELVVQLAIVAAGGLGVYVTALHFAQVIADASPF